MATFIPGGGIYPSGITLPPVAQWVLPGTASPTQQLVNAGAATFGIVNNGEDFEIALLFAPESFNLQPALSIGGNPSTAGTADFNVQYGPSYWLFIRGPAGGPRIPTQYGIWINQYPLAGWVRDGRTPDPNVTSRFTPPVTPWNLGWVPTGASPNNPNNPYLGQLTTYMRTNTGIAGALNGIAGLQEIQFFVLIPNVTVTSWLAVLSFPGTVTL